MEHKVILNGCYGGYGWSKQGVIEVLKAKGFHNLHFWLRKNWSSGGDDEVSKQEFLSDKYNWWFVKADEDETSIEWLGFDREDPEAIKVLEERGSELCSGYHARLYIDSFDDEFYDYTIDEYDGAETLELHPRLHLDQVLKCKSVYEVADLLLKIGVIPKEEVKEDETW